MAFDTDERSPIWGFAATSALAGGAGYSIYNNKSAITEILRSNPGSVNESVISAVARAPSFNVGRTFSSALDSNAVQGFASTIQSQVGTGVAKSDIFHSAYESMISTGKITPSDALSRLAGIKEETNVLGALGVASEAIETGGGNAGVFTSRLKDLAIGKRMSRLSSLSASPGDFGIGLPQSLQYSDLAEPFRQRRAQLVENISAAATNKELMPTFGTIYKGTVDNPLMSVMVGNEEFNIPLNTKAKSINLGGTNYNLRGAYGPGGQEMSYSELMEGTIKDMLAKSRNQTQLRQEVHKANQRLIQNIRDRDSAHLAAAIWSAPDQALTSGGLAANRLRNLERVAFGLDDEGIQSMIGTKVYPYTSPVSAAKGTMSSVHLPQYLFGDLGLLSSPESRPGQFIRGEWGSTKAAKEAALNRNFVGELGNYYNRLERKGVTEGYKQLAYNGLSAADERAYAVPQLLTYYAKPAGADTSGLGFADPVLNRLMAAEENVVSPEAAALMEHERSFMKRISLGKGLETESRILEALKEKTQGEFVGLNIAPAPGQGYEYGVELSSGKRLTLQESEALSQRIVGAQLVGNDEAIIHLKESRRLTPGQWLKTFSEEQKGLTAAADSERWNKILGAIGINEAGGQQIEQVTAGKLVQREKRALITQQMEAMSVFAAQKLQSGVDAPAEAAIRNFLQDPAKASRVSQLMAGEGANAHIAIQKNLIGLARNKFGFSPTEMGMTFGLADKDVFNQLVKAGSLRAEEAYGIYNSKGVIGLGKGFVGDLASANWGRGSFEQTGFRLLSMKGQEGIDYAAELSKRIMNKGELGALSKMEMSILNEDSFMSKISRGALEGIGEGDLIREKGRYVDLGVSLKSFGRSNALYIPGTNEAPYSIGRTVARTKEIESPLEKELQYFQKSVQLFKDKKIAEEELELAGEGLRNAVFRATEEQASARGKIIGSRIATNIRQGTGSAHAMSEIDIKRMYNDLLERAAPSQARELRTQLATLEEGGQVATAMWRHPTTGPESLQFVNLKMDTSLAEGMVAVPYKEGKMTISGGAKGGVRTVDLSSMVGVKGDFDRDQLVISAISDADTQRKVARRIANQSEQEYTRYIFNHYGMKDFFDQRTSKGDVLKMNTPEALRAGWTRLTTAKTTTGQVNLALQQFKIGLAYNSPEKYKPMAELFWNLEEAAISGKHGVLNTELYQAIGEASKGGEAGIQKMKQVLTNVFGGENIALTGDITTEAGKTMRQSLSFNVDDLARQAVESGTAVRDEVKVAMDAVRLGKGKSIGDVPLGAHVERMFLRKRGSVDIAGLLLQAGTEDMGGITSKAERTISSLESKATGVLKAIGRNKKFLLGGAAAAAGIMLMAPSVSGVVSNPNMSGGGSNLGEEEISPPPSGSGMTPPPPRPNSSPRIYDIGSSRPTTHANIRMRTNDFDSSYQDFMGKARSLSSSGRVNIKTEDNRHLLDPMSLASKIHERL